MKGLLRIGCPVLFISSLYRSVDAQSQTPALEEVVASVRRNVIQFRDTLPDFVCRFHESRFPQHAQVLGDGWLRQFKLVLDVANSALGREQQA
jgi:hypothetical protein